MPKLPLWNVLDNGMSSRGKRKSWNRTAPGCLNQIDPLPAPLTPVGAAASASGWMRPGKPGRSQISIVRTSGGGLGRLDLQNLAGARDRDRPGFHRLRDLTHKVDVQEPVLQPCACEQRKRALKAATTH